MDLRNNGILLDENGIHTNVSNRIQNSHSGKVSTTANCYESLFVSEVRGHLGGYWGHIIVNVSC
jgi:hypothetical protein